MPTSKKITVDLSSLSAKTTVVSWYDPRTGKSFQGEECPATRSKEFSPPGTGDWVFVAEDAVAR